MEFGGKINNIANFILGTIQNLIVKLFKFQYDFSGILRIKNYKKIQSTNHLIMTNTRIGHSLLPFIFLFKINK